MMLIAANDNTHLRPWTWRERVNERLSLGVTVLYSAAFYLAVGYAVWRGLNS